jgi:hypothetical protein
MRRELGRSSLPIILVVAEKESLVDKQIGPYKIVRLIGSGGMGTVYEAVHSQIGRRAAIKMLSKDFQQDAEFIQRFFNEARAVNIINHPSVVTVYDFGSAEDGSPYIVMEYLEGESLRQRMNKSGRTDPQRAMKLTRQVASGLAAAHAKKIVHRDLKPGNILLVPDADNPDGERPKILDFGIAKLAADPSAKALTRMGVSMGTPAYMSPELCKDARDVTDRSDVYALGLILFEMLAGEHPFAHALKADSAMMASHIGQPPPTLDSKVPGLGADLVGLVNRMLAKQPDARPSAAEVAATLGRLGGSVTGLMPIIDGSALNLPPDPGRAIPEAAAGLDVGLSAFVKPLQENRGLVIGAGVMLLLGVIGIGVILRLILAGPPQVPQPVRWTIQSEPAGADVLDATGQLIGKTPLVHQRQRGTSVEILSVRKEGFSEARIPCDTSKDFTQLVTLVPQPQAADRKAAPEGSAKQDEASTTRSKSKDRKHRKSSRSKQK